MGWSDWSQPSNPVAPQPGVIMSKKMNLKDNKSIATIDELGGTKLTTTIALEWFSPNLTNNRQITSYEVQLCHLIGAMKKNVNFLSALSSKESEESFGMDFINYRDDVKRSEVNVLGLKGGGKYQFRVRPQINGIW